MYITEHKNPFEKIILGSFTHAQHRDRDTEDFIIFSALCTRHKLSGCHSFCSRSDCFPTDPHSGPGCSQSPASVFTLKCSARPRVELTRRCVILLYVALHNTSETIRNVKFPTWFTCQPCTVLCNVWYTGSFSTHTGVRGDQQSNGTIRSRIVQDKYSRSL